ncbi:hypothetical protein BJX70DRAFT_402920 [Aspergillus crustosus]
MEKLKAEWAEKDCQKELLVCSAAAGDMETFNSTADAAFTHFIAFNSTFEQVIVTAIQTENQPVVDGVVSRAIALPENEYGRKDFFDAALDAALFARNTAALKALLKADYPTKNIEKALKSTITLASAADEERDLLEILLADLMRDKKNQSVAVAKQWDCEVDDSLTTCTLQRERADVLLDLIVLCTERKVPQLTKLFLPPWLDCCADYFWRLPFFLGKREQVQSIPVEEFFIFSREQCFDYLSEQLPSEVRAALFRRLGAAQIEDKEPRDTFIEYNSTLYSIHKDVLCYWSEYFARWFVERPDDNSSIWGKWKWTSEDTLKAVIDFMYQGKYRYTMVEGEDRRQVLQNHLMAANFFGIHAMREHIRGLIYEDAYGGMYTGIWPYLIG